MQVGEGAKSDMYPQLSFIIDITPHRYAMHTYSVICLCVFVCLLLDRDPCKTDESIEMPFGVYSHGNNNKHICISP